MNYYYSLDISTRKHQVTCSLSGRIKHDHDRENAFWLSYCRHPINCWDSDRHQPSSSSCGGGRLKSRWGSAGSQSRACTSGCCLPRAPAWAGARPRRRRRCCCYHCRYRRHCRCRCRCRRYLLSLLPSFLLLFVDCCLPRCCHCCLCHHYLLSPRYGHNLLLRKSLF